MKTLEFKTQINAPKQKVWDRMIDPASYTEWTNVSWPGSRYEGKWEEGENIKFIGPDGSGTLATLTKNRPYDVVEAKHVAILLPGGTEDRVSHDAAKWIGTTERYQFKERNGLTDLIVTLQTTPEWEKMFNDGWPLALEKLKEIAER